MGRFRIQSHGRLQEWVAEEKGYFKDEGLDYDFIVKPIATWSGNVQSTELAPPELREGAFESFGDLGFLLRLNLSLLAGLHI
jgi:hypothetical protein